MLNISQSLSMLAKTIELLLFLQSGCKLVHHASKDFSRAKMLETPHCHWPWSSVDEQCNALPTKIAIFQTITHHRTPPIFSTFSIPQYIHTQPAFLSLSIIEVLLKVLSRQFVTSIISIISDLFTTGSWRHHFYPLLPSTLQFVSSKTVQYWSHKNEIYTKSTILHKLSEELPYSVGSFRIWNTRYTVSTLQQLRLSPHHFQVPVLKLSNIRSIHQHTAFLRYRLWCFKHNSSSSTLHPVNHRRVIKSLSVPAYNSMFWKSFEEAVKSIGVVSRSSRAVFIGYKFFLNFICLFFLFFVPFCGIGNLFFIIYFLFVRNVSLLVTNSIFQTPDISISRKLNRINRVIMSR